MLIYYLKNRTKWKFRSGNIMLKLYHLIYELKLKLQEECIEWMNEWMFNDTTTQCIDVNKN